MVKFGVYDVDNPREVENEGRAKRSCCFYLGVGVMAVSTVSLCLLLRAVYNVFGNMAEGGQNIGKGTNKPAVGIIEGMSSVVAMMVVINVMVPIAVVLLVLICGGCCCMWRGRKRVKKD